MPFAPTVTHHSKIAGVRFTVHRMGFGRRTDLDFQTLKLRQRLRELEAEHPPQSDREKELSHQLALAVRKANKVPAEEYDAVMEKDVTPISEELAACVPPEVKKRRLVLDEEYIQVENRIKEFWIRTGLVSIQGGDVDGMTAEQLLEYGPPHLAAEIYDAMESDGRLSGTETKNLPLPITSGAPEDGEKTNTIATSAGALKADGISSETASAISQAT